VRREKFRSRKSLRHYREQRLAAWRKLWSAILPSKYEYFDGKKMRVCCADTHFGCDYILVWIFTPGPMVEAVTQDRIYWPLAAAGLALMIAPMSAS